MKKSLLALAALTAFVGVASAQSSVTVFGIVDLAARNVKNGSVGSLKTLSNDGSYSSRLGFRGVEDIGGGMRAGFWLEAGMSADTGAVGAPAPSAFFNRRATVSLLGDFGEIRLGRDYVPTFWNHTVFDPFGTQGVGSANNLLTPASPTTGSNTTRVLGVGSTASGDARTGTFVRADNSIGYFLPALGGVYGQAMVAAGETNPNNGNKFVGGRIGYAAGPVNIAAAYGKTYLTQRDDREYNVAGSFNAGFATFWAQYSNVKVENGEPATATSLGAPGGRELKNAMAGITIPVGAGTIKATYAKTKGTFELWTGAGTVAAGNKTYTSGSGDANQIAVGYVYDLSKRTSLYTHYSQIKNSGAARFYASGSGLLNQATGFKSTGYEFGVRHSF